MGTRIYDFVTGIETSDAPTAGTPSATGDILTLGYADTTYARRRDWGFPVANYAALKAITTSGDNQRYNDQIRFVEDTNETWAFNAASSATEDGSTILAPDSGTGRWLIVSGSNGAGGGSANALEMLSTKLERDLLTGRITKLDDSVGLVALGEGAYDSISGCLFESYTSGGSTVSVVWNPQTVSTTDQNFDGTNGWTAVNAGTTLTATNTAGEFKVGTHGLKFNKDNSATTAAIRHDRGSQNLSLSAHWRMFFYIKLPSLTNLTNVYVRAYADSTSNYAQWSLLSNYAGTALAADWNLCFVDLSTTPTSTGGTGWTRNLLSRYVEIGVTTSSSAQTYTGIIIDSLYFSLGDVIKKIGPIGTEFSIFDTSNKNNIIIDDGNVSGDGVLSLATTLNNSYTGGLGGSGAGRIKRSTVEYVGKTYTFDTDLSSGSIANQQELRISSQMRESKSGTYAGFIDLYQPEVFEVKSISGNSVSGSDFGNVSANCLSGNTFDVLQAIYQDSYLYTIWKGTATLGGNSSFDSGNNYINLPFVSSTGIVVGDYISKRAVTGQLSCAPSGGNESFQAEDLQDSPDNVEIIEFNHNYLYTDKVYGHWRMGGLTDAEAFNNKYGTGNVTQQAQGGITKNAEFDKGRFAASNFSDSNYISPSAVVTDLNGDNERVGLSMWFYVGTGFTGASRCLFNAYTTNTTTNGWYVFIGSGDNTLNWQKYSASSGTENGGNGLPIKVNSWNYVFISITHGANTLFYVNGASILSTTNGAIGGGGTDIRFGRGGSNSIALNSLDRIGETVIWRDAPIFSVGQVDSIYNGGNFRPFNFGPGVRYRYEMSAGSGQRLSMKATVNKATSVIKSPYIQKMGMIKTS